MRPPLTALPLREESSGRNRLHADSQGLGPTRGGREGSWVEGIAESMFLLALLEEEKEGDASDCRKERKKGVEKERLGGKGGWRDETSCGGMKMHRDALHLQVLI